MTKKKNDVKLVDSTRKAYEWVKEWEHQSFLAQLFVPLSAAYRLERIAEIDRKLTEIEAREAEIKGRLAELDAAQVAETGKVG